MHRANEAAARELWNEIHRAALMGDDRELWFAWKKNFPSRFWVDLGASGMSALCREAGLDFTDILRRVTAYHMSLDRETRDVEEKRVRDSQSKLRIA